MSRQVFFFPLSLSFLCLFFFLFIHFSPSIPPFPPNQLLSSHAPLSCLANRCIQSGPPPLTQHPQGKGAHPQRLWAFRGTSRIQSTGYGTYLSDILRTRRFCGASVGRKHGSLCEGDRCGRRQSESQHEGFVFFIVCEVRCKM